MLALGQWDAGSLDMQQFLCFSKCCPKEHDSNCGKAAKRAQTKLNQTTEHEGPVYFHCNLPLAPAMPFLKVHAFSKYYEPPEILLCSIL